MPGVLEKRLNDSQPPKKNKKQNHENPSEDSFGDDIFNEDISDSDENSSKAEEPTEEENKNDGILAARMKGKKIERRHPETEGGHVNSSVDDEEFDESADFDNPENRPDQMMTEEDEKELQELEEMMSEETRLKEEKRSRLLRRVSQIAMTIACVYMIVLIFGSFITEYHYNDEGIIEPVILSVSDIEEKNEFGTLATLYLQARSLYETVLVLDYRVAANEEELMAIAPEYEEALDTVSTLATTIEAADLLSKYNQVSTMLLTWVQTHMAAYCQYMSAAITQNNNNAAEEALAARTVVYSDFQLITENIINLGEDVPAYDLTNIKAWSPEGYVEEAVEGVT